MTSLIHKMAVASVPRVGDNQSPTGYGVHQIDLGRNTTMSLLRKFSKEVLVKSHGAKPSTKNSSPADAGKTPSSGGLINPFAKDEKSEEPDGGKTPASGGLINPFAEDKPATPQAPADDAVTRAKQFFDEGEALFKKNQYAQAAVQYWSAYQ